MEDEGLEELQLAGGRSRWARKFPRPLGQVEDEDVNFSESVIASTALPVRRQILLACVFSFCVGGF